MVRRLYYPGNKYVLLFLFSFLFITARSQTRGDSKIIIAAKDTAGIYEKVRTAFVRSNFLIRDLNVRDTLSTYPTEFGELYITAFAIFKNNTIIINGRYSLKMVNYLGYNSDSKDFHRILFYKGSKTWKALMRVATIIGGNISYDK